MQCVFVTKKSEKKVQSVLSKLIHKAIEEHRQKKFNDRELSVVKCQEK